MVRIGRYVWALAALFALAASDVIAGDAVVARSLLDGGKKALTAKKYDEAIPLFRKALSEDPTLVEASYWRAQAHEKANDTIAALAAYREFLDLLAKKQSPTPDDLKLKPLAEKRVDALALADKEFQKLEEKFVADLLAIARAKVASDPGAALAAAQRVLEVQPKNAEALALQERLGEKKQENPLAGVDQWRDLVKDKSLHSDVVKFPGELMTIEVKTSGKIRPDPALTMGADYAGEMEFHLAATFEDGWSVGFSLGETKDGYYAVRIERAQVTVMYGKPKQRPESIASRASAPLDTAAWHRLAFAVHGARIVVMVDGEKVIDEAQGQRDDFSGEAGVSVGYGRVEFRSVRVGSFK